MRIRADWLGSLLLLLVGCGGTTTPAAGGGAADVAADVQQGSDAAVDSAPADVSDVQVDDAATDASAPDAADDAAADVVDAMNVADADDAVDAVSGDDALLSDDAGADAVVDTVADADWGDGMVDAGPDAGDVTGTADADAVSADVDAGPTPLGLMAAVTLTAPVDGAVVNVGDTVAVSLAVDATPPTGNWTMSVSLGAGATVTESFETLPQVHSILVKVLQAGSQTVTLQVWQDGVLVAEKSVQITGNLAPTGVPVLGIAPTPATVQSDLLASVVQPSVDPEGAQLTWTWSWLLDGQPTTFAGPSVPAQWLKKGETWTVSAIASDGHASGPMGTTQVVIGNSPPTAAVLASAPASVALTGTAAATIEVPGMDPDGDTLTTTFAWMWQGQLVGETPTLQVPTVLLNGQHLTPGDLLLTATVTDTDGAQTATKKTIAIVAAPVCGTPWWTCDAHATCADNATLTPLCTCNPGYGGTGIQCSDVDECWLGTAACDVNAACGNTEGGYTCTCNAGWKGNGATCGDINECLDASLNACDGHADCLNGDGGYDCKCQKGWEGSGLTCTDIDECLSGTASCGAHAKCQNSIGSFTCVCDSGYGGPACTDIDECKAGTAVCDTNATCGNTDGGYICGCNVGFLGDGKSCVAVCELYCGAVTKNCGGLNQQYADLAACVQTCTTSAAWPVGQVGDISGDTVACRYTQANSASLAPASFCSAAGPTGGGVCGTLCDSYCDLMVHSCTDTFASASDCQSTCAAFPSTGAIGDTTGDSLQCRLGYALAAPVTGCGPASAISNKCRNAVDLSGWKIEQTLSTQSFTVPAGTTVAIGGYLLLSRASSKADFESFWGVTLGDNVTFLQSATTIGSTTACPQINGDETFTLKAADGSIVDGPTVGMTANGKFIFERVDPTVPADTSTAWTAADYNVKTNATPGAGATPGKVAGAYISEFADAAGTGMYIYEFVEVYVDPGP